MFPNPEKLEKKIRSISGYMVDNTICQHVVPTVGRSSTIALNNNKTINTKHNHLPIASACTIIIHKSQGPDLNEIVYEYQVSYSQQLVCIVLSRVTRIEGLHIVSKNNQRKIAHGRRESSTVSDLIMEEFTCTCSRS